ncbi:putative aarF domain-containing protein kinase [Senna tora]|uniref:Putative aarF domain-containing protein kinase n=1 Tax=Senna tora TaxID=362788 RepID=A0A834TGF9_9FABA|nr:putative aarF domain-containing protein kinase [Senna tora]
MLLSLSSFPATLKPQSPPPSLFPPNQCNSSLPLSPHPHHCSGTHRPGRCAAMVSGSGDGEIDTFTARSGYLFDLSTSEADSLAEYSVSKIAAIYRRKPFVVFRRLFQIGTTFGKWFGLRYIDTLMERSDEMFEVRAAELRKILTELGPAYIKIAQAISSRPDLIPPSYLDELSLLQDRISPFSTEVAFNMIEQELGLPIDELFSEISPVPVAAASLGQVYQARLRQKGQVVAVKVQRPGVQAAISLDMLILRFLAGLVRRAGKFNTDLQAVVDEWASSLFREMDYKNEASNGLKFRNLYGSIQDVVVPLMYMEYTTRKVLVMEWIEGQKLSEVKDLYLIEVGVYCSFNQLLEYGFYHADPHPGNLLRTYDGKLAYLDFGMTGEFKQELRDGFMEACLHLVNRDFQALARDFVTLGLLPPTSDREAVTKALTGVFQNAVAKGVRNISFGDLLGNLGTTMYKFKFRIPSYFSLVIRSLAVLEGIAVSFNPEYKVLGSTYPWIARKVLTDSSPQLKSSLQTLLYKDGTFRIDRLESLLKESLRAKTEKALVKNQTDNTDSRMVMKEILSFTLTEKGAFVREIILQEFAKGLDALGLATLDSITSTATANIPFSAFFLSSLMTDEDKSNLRTFQRLMLLLSGTRRNEDSNVGGRQVSPYKNQQPMSLEELPLDLNQLESFQEILPVLSIIPELPTESQQQLLQLPADLVQRLISRAAARTLRRDL